MLTENEIKDLNDCIAKQFNIITTAVIISNNITDPIMISEINKAKNIACEGIFSAFTGFDKTVKLIMHKEERGN